MYKVLGMLAEKSNIANDIYYLQQIYKSHDIKSQRKITFFSSSFAFHGTDLFQLLFTVTVSLTGAVS